VIIVLYVCYFDPNYTLPKLGMDTLHVHPLRGFGAFSILRTSSWAWGCFDAFNTRRLMIFVGVWRRFYKKITIITETIWNSTSAPTWRLHNFIIWTSILVIQNSTPHNFDLLNATTSSVLWLDKYFEQFWTFEIGRESGQLHKCIDPKNLNALHDYTSNFDLHDTKIVNF
jgi:hypothetical protein